jgi:DNA ligase 1
MEFRKVAAAFDEIGKVTGRLEITRLLAELFKEASAHETNIIVNLALGMLHPQYKGTRFNFAKKSFLNVLADLGQTTREKIEALYAKLGDLGTVAEQISSARPKKHLTVLQLYEHLDALEKVSGVGSQEEKSRMALELLQSVEPISAKYIVRMILDELRLGFSDMTIIDALSWMEVGSKKLRPELEEGYNICADIGLIAQMLKEHGIEAIKKMKIHPGIPVRLAAAERLPNAAAIVEKLGPCVAQPKLDGLRLEVHVNNKAKKDEKRVTLFSRNLLDVTDMYPDLVPALEQLPVKQIICDGEVIVYDPNTGSYLPFQETAKRKRKYDIEKMVTELPVQLNVFDLLYLDGKDVIDQPHYVRRDLLENVLQEAHSKTIRCIEEVKINTAEDLEKYFLKNIDEGLEGVVVKKPDSLYQAGKRNFNWIKLKRLQHGELEDTIDCVILGYNRGSGKRAGFGIGAFLVGIYNKRKDCFQTVAKVGTGLSDADWKELKKKCDDVVIREKPKNVECSKELYPDVWTAPKIVCSILADEITLSPLHTAGKTEQHLGFGLRFPRFINYRPDKTPEQATDIEELREMFHDQKMRKQ